MSFLLDQDTCAAFVRTVPLVSNRFLQHLGNMNVSAVTVMGLELWLLRPKTPVRYLQTYGAMMRQLTVLNVDDNIAHQAARIGTKLRSQKPLLGPVDLLMAATAIVHQLILVTHSTQAFGNIPGLTVVDWLVP